jgi:hypothetical protein
VVGFSALDFLRSCLETGVLIFSALFNRINNLLCVVQLNFAIRGKAYFYKGENTCIQMYIWFCNEVYIWFCNKVYFKLCQAMVFILNMIMDSINSQIPLLHTSFMK